MTVEDISKQIATWKRGATGYAFLIDEKGNVIAHPTAQLVQKRENLNSYPLVAEFRRKGWTTLTTLFTAPDGEGALGHARSNNLGWILALQQEEREVFDSLNVLQNFAVALLAVTALLAAAIAWFSARAIAKPVMKLTDAAERMSMGDLNVRIDVRSGDEDRPARPGDRPHADQPANGHGEAAQKRDECRKIGKCQKCPKLRRISVAADVHGQAVTHI